MQHSTLNRSRVSDAIHGYRAIPALFVTAPAGYGKSVALKDYLQEHALGYVWSSALHRDDRQLWHSICEDIVAKRKNGEALLSIGFPMERCAIPKIIEKFKQAVAPIVIVIDDYHLLAEDSLFHHMLLALALERIYGLRIICVGRSVPKWLLSEMYAKGLCAGITAATLAFDKAEVLSYLKLRKIPAAMAARTQAEKILKVSEGWAAAVVLSVDELFHKRKTSALESMYNIFEHILFHELHESEQILLVKLAIVGDFSIQKAIYIFECEKISKEIESLYNKNLFIEYSLHTKKYRIHEVFRKFLVDKSASYAIDKNGIILNLARWEHSQGQYADSLAHYHQCGCSTEFFERLSIEKIYYISFLSHDLYYNVLKRIPADNFMRFPLVYIHIFLFFLISGIAERERFALKCLSFMRKNFLNEKYEHAQLKRIASSLKFVLHISNFNNPFKLFKINYCIGSDELIDTVYSFVSVLSMSAGLPSLLFCYYRNQGELDDVVEFVESNFDCEGLGGLGYGFDKLLHAEKHLERGELEQAAIYAKQAIQKGWLREQVFIIACAHAVLERIALLRGDVFEAETQRGIMKSNILKNLSFVPDDGLVSLYDAMIDMHKFVMFVISNNEIPINKNDNYQILKNKYLYGGVGIPELINIKLKIFSGEFYDAEVLCDHYETIHAKYPSQMGSLRQKIYRAEINKHLYGEDSAIISLRNALEEAALDNVTMPFAENAKFILSLWGSIAPTERLPESFLQKVHGICLQTRDNLRRARTLMIKKTLTRREREIFALLSEGLAQKDIADTLHISTPTVKRHLENIYLKLDVHNRVAALNKGRLLGILDTHVD